MPRRCFYCGDEATELEFGIPTWAPASSGSTIVEIEHLIDVGRAPAGAG